LEPFPQLAGKIRWKRRARNTGGQQAVSAKKKDHRK